MRLTDTFAKLALVCAPPFEGEVVVRVTDGQVDGFEVAVDEDAGEAVRICVQNRVAALFGEVAAFGPQAN